MRNLNSFIINKDDKIQPISRWDSDNTRTIVFSTDNNYAKYFSVALQSLIETSENDKNYDIIVVENKILDNYKYHLLKMLPDNFSLRFFDIDDYIENNFDVNLFIAKSYWSIVTWYRCFIPFLMSDYKKVLYADLDMIFNKSIEELFNIDFENKEIIAVRDSFSLRSQMDLIRKNYIEETLNLDSAESYFNSGVIMFNIKKINIKEYRNDLEKYLKIPKLQYLDQDVLNAVFNRKKKLVSFVYNFPYHTLIWFQNEIETYPKDFSYGRENPVIIHYTGEIKPWRNPCNEFCVEWWAFARRTPFYEEILYSNLENKFVNITKQKFYNHFLEYIFSLKNSWNKKHKVITILGLKIKFKVKC